MKKIIGVVVAILILIVASVISQLTKAILGASEFGEKLYPSLGKLAFFLEAIISLSPLIIGIWLIKLSWRKITYEEPIVESTENKDASSSLTKAVYNHAKDIAAEVKPTISEYKQKHATSQTQVENQDIDLVDEDAIYEQVMLEIEEDKKVKSTWAKALAQSDGDREKAEALYIKLRVETIKIELETELEIKLKARLAAEEEADRLSSEEKKLLEEIMMKKLSEFLLKNNMEFNKKISDNKVKTNIKGSVFDSYLEYDGTEWRLSDKAFYADGY